jgi:metal-responsive CopG/Arc/MetJ family transcriptional regulator
MSKQTQKRKMGRPPKPGGAATVVPVRIAPDVLVLLDAYAHRGGFTRSEAVRQLIEAGLKRSAKTRPLE